MVRRDDNKASDEVKPEVDEEAAEEKHKNLSRVLGTEHGTNGDCDKFSWPILPPEFWELQELVQNGCPEEALRVFRKSVIGKKNPLTAAQADAAIAGAEKACATGKIVDKRKDKRVFELPSVEAHMSLMHWYAREGIPACFARPYGYEWSELELDFIREHEDEHVLTFLSFDDDGVDRVEAPYVEDAEDESV